MCNIQENNIKQRENEIQVESDSLASNPGFII